MKYKILLIFLFILTGCRSFVGWYGNSPAPKDDIVLSLEHGFQAERIKYNNTIYDIIIIDPKIIKLDVAVDSNGKGILINDIVDTAVKEDILFITNAGMFTKEKKALGYLSYKKEQISPINLKESDYGNFYLKPNGVFFIQNNKSFILETNEFKEQILNNNIIPYVATQSGPLLLKNNIIHHELNKGSKNKLIRNGVGTIKDSDLAVFVIANKPVNFFDFSMVFKEFLNCDFALYLDGNISFMYAPELNREQKCHNLGPLIYAIK